MPAFHRIAGNAIVDVMVKNGMWEVGRKRRYADLSLWELLLEQWGIFTKLMCSIMGELGKT